MHITQAVDSYIATRKADGTADQTIRSHRSRLQQFVDWCAVEDVSEIDSKLLNDYKQWKGEKVKAVTLKSHLSTLRCFVRHLENLEEVPPGTHERIQLPQLDESQGVRDEYIDSGRAEEVLEYVRKYEYASVRHVTLLLLWKTGLRRGSIASIDISDVHIEERYIELQHRPESETPLKNKINGERLVAIRDETASVLEEYIEEQRPNVWDEYDRRPLLSNGGGRLHATTVTQYAYAYTRPCYISQKCPHERDPESCEATQWNSASKCPSSRSSHAWRRGAITHSLREDVPVEAVSDRMNVDRDTIEKHYNQMTPEEKMEQRRDYFD